MYYHYLETMHLIGSYETPTPDTTYKTLTLSTTFHAHNIFILFPALSQNNYFTEQSKGTSVGQFEYLKNILKLFAIYSLTPCFFGRGLIQLKDTSGITRLAKQSIPRDYGNPNLRHNYCVWKFNLIISTKYSTDIKQNIEEKYTGMYSMEG